MTQASLQGLRVLVTRPREQAGSLCQAIKNAGGQVIDYPMMEIVGMQVDSLPVLSRYQIIIFISANAVRQGLANLPGLPNTLKIACIGQQTAQAVKTADYTVDYVPQENFTSEGLLELADLQQLDGQKILIVRGQGGRETLKQTLEQRGAEVDYFECYRRQLPMLDFQPLRYAMHNGDIDIITCSSNQGLMNLIQVCPMAPALPLISISQNMTEKALQMGFKDIPQQAINASDHAILESLYKFVSKSAE